MEEILKTVMRKDRFLSFHFLDDNFYQVYLSDVIRYYSFVRNVFTQSKTQLRFLDEADKIEDRKNREPIYLMVSRCRLRLRITFDFPSGVDAGRLCRLPAPRFNHVVRFISSSERRGGSISQRAS